MGYVGIDSAGARQFGQVLTGTSARAEQLRWQILGALTVAGLDSVVPGLLVRVQDGLADLAETVAGRAAAADRPGAAAEMWSIPWLESQLVAPVPEGLSLIGVSPSPDSSMGWTEAGQTFDSGPTGALTTLLAQTSVSDDGALAGSAGQTLRLPTTPAEAQDFLADVRARFDRAPGEPIRFDDRGVSVTILNNPEGFPVVRQPGQRLTESIDDLDTPAYEVIIDGELGEANPNTLVNRGLLFAQRSLGPVDVGQVQAQGIVVVEGNQVAGRSSPLTFYLALDAPDPADAGAPGWRIGAGDPPPDAHLAFGGGIPVIIDGLPYGVTNLYLPGAPANLPERGDPGPGNGQFLAQRSNSGFADQESGGASLGKALTGLGPDGTVYILVQQDGASGVTLSTLRDMLARVGVRDAVSWDGSDSALQVVDGDIVVQPGRVKDNSIPVGIGFRLPFSEQGLTDWAADRVPGTSLSFGSSPVEAGIPVDDVADPSGTLSYYGGAPAVSAPLPASGAGDFGSVDLQQFDLASTFTTSDVLSAYSADAATDFGDYDLGSYDTGEYDTGIYDPGTYDVGDF